MPKGYYESYVGKKLGSLEVLEEFKNSYKNIICKVKCDCGRKFEISKKAIKSRIDNNTGCNCKRTDDTDVLNKRFGKLVVLELTGYKNRRKIFKCQCDCGSVVERNKSQIINGCGYCGDNAKHNEIYKNIIGQVFGKLTVIKEVERNDYGGRQYLCHCDCGKEKVFQGSNLMYGESTSCGCILTSYYQEGSMINLLKKKEAYPNSKSGIKGVWQDKKGYWHAIITVSGNRMFFYGGAGEEGKRKAITWREEMFMVDKEVNNFNTKR